MREVLRKWTQTNGNTNRWKFKKYNVENQEKLRVVVFNIVWGLGGGRRG